jgi:hypothetical protein
MSVNDLTVDADKDQAEKILQEKLGNPENKSVVAPISEPMVDAKSEPISSEEDIEKPIGHKEWVFEAEYEVMLKGDMTPQIFKRTYVQKPLSYHAFGEFTGLLGRKLAEAMRGPDGLSLDRLTPGEASIPLEFNDGQISLAGGEDNDLIDPIIQGIAKLASYVPDLMGEAQCIWLRVPRTERPLLIDIWSRPVDEGGMSMDQGEEMLNVFIEQNYEELNNFLKRYARVKDTVQKMRSRLTKDA